MSIKNFSSEEEMDDHLEMIEEINHQHLNFKEEVDDCRRALENAEEDLTNFIEDNKEYLI